MISTNNETIRSIDMKRKRTNEYITCSWFAIRRFDLNRTTHLKWKMNIILLFKMSKTSTLSCFFSSSFFRVSLSFSNLLCLPLLSRIIRIWNDEKTIQWMAWHFRLNQRSIQLSLKINCLACQTMICICIDAFFSRSFNSLLYITRKAHVHCKLARGDFRFCMDLTFVTIVIRYDMFAAVPPSACLSLTSMTIIVGSRRLSSK